MTDDAADAALGRQVTFEPYAAGGGLPLFLRPRTGALSNDPRAVIEWFRENRAALEGLAHEHGAIVLRGFPLTEATAYERLVSAYPPPSFGYVGGATQRAPLGQNVFESTSHPAAHRLPLHQEMAYLPYFPKMLVFYCHVAAETGGETIIRDMRAFTRQVPESLRAPMRAKGVRYVRNYRDPDWSSGSALWDQYHKHWHDAMGTTDRAIAEEFCRATGMVPRWEPNGSFSMIYEGPAFITHPDTEEEIWFNQVLTMSYTRTIIGAERFDALEGLYGDGAPPPVAVTFGDGSPFDLDELDRLRAVLDTDVSAFRWQAGDVMLVDNFATAHGRNPFTGRRDIRVSLVA